MKMTNVESSNIAAVGYDEETKELRIEFNSGKTYSYQDVPKELATDLLYADSVGRYFHAHIRNAGFEYAQV